MAGDWIKMRTDLYRDPKVCLMADLLMNEEGELSRYVNQNTQRDMTVTRNVMRNVTVGALVSTWGVLRHRGKRQLDDLTLKGCTLSIIDDVSEIPGFGEAMKFVGWVIETDEGIVLPNFFEEFNVDPEEDSRKKNAERQRRYREKQASKNNANGNVTVTSESNVREEKRRISKPSANSDPRFEEFWSAYPRKVGKGNAEKSWSKVCHEFDAIMAALKVQTQAWTDPQYIPHPATWLNGKRWLDEVTPASQTTPKLAAI